MSNDFKTMDLSASVHTLSVNSKNNVGNILSNPIDYPNGFTYKVNPESISNTMNLSAVNFNTEILRLVSDYGMIEPRVTRMDFCWNFYNIDYADLYRNFALLDLMFCRALNKKNIDLFITFNPLSGKLKTVCVKSHESEKEYYNKADKNPRLGISARFEFRLKRRAISIDETFDIRKLIFDVFEDFCRCITIENYKETTSMVTKLILHRANSAEFFAKKADKVNYIKNNAYMIFERAQLVNLCKELIYKPEGFSEKDSAVKAENKVRNMNIKEVTIKATLEDNRKEEMFTRFNCISFKETKSLVNMLFKAMLGYLKDSYKNASKTEIRDLYERVKPFVNYQEVKKIINSAD